MKSIFALSVLLSSFAAFSATVTTFTCELEKIPGQKVSFRIENLGKSNMSVLSLDQNDDYSGIFSTKSKHVTIQNLVDTINGQGGDMRVGSDRISFFGDNAGVDFAYFDLFKSSGYTQGFVRMEFNFGEEKSYSKVNCTKK